MAERLLVELFSASTKGDLVKVKQVMERLRRVDSEPGRQEHSRNPLDLHTSRTLLLGACWEDHLDVVEYFIDDLEIAPICEDEDGDTPLHIAAEVGSLELVEYLMEKGCDAACRNEKADTPLHAAALGGKLDTLRCLVKEKECDRERRGQYGRSPLHHACDCGALDVVQYLIEELKVDPSCRDENDDTPLHIACMTGHLQIVKLLVEDYHCDLNIKDKWERTPHNCADKCGKERITSYLSSEDITVFSKRASCCCVYICSYVLCHMSLWLQLAYTSLYSPLI